MKTEHEELIQGFVAHEKKLGQRSLRKLPYLLRPFFTWLDEAGLSFTDINYRKANEFRSSLSCLKNDDGSVHYAGSTIYDIVHTTKRLFDYLKTQSQVYGNPFAGLKRMKRETRLPRNIPDEAKLDELLGGLREFWKEPCLWDRRAVYKVHVIAEVLYATGLRVAEAAALRVEDIDFERNLVTVRNGKGGRDRTAYLNEYASRVLKLYIQRMRQTVNRGENNNLFGVENGRMLEGALNRRLNEYGDKCGIGRYTSHNFRHALGFHLLRRGCDMRYIQLILGHEALASTAIYTKVEKTDLRRELDARHPRVFAKK